MWGFYPDERNPHRVGFSVLPVDGEPFTYWVEPAWMSRYARFVMEGPRRAVGLAPPPPPHPPHHLTLPVGFGAPDDWDDERHEAAKLECWLLTTNGWHNARDRLLRGL